jgi:polyisoprenyl-phosphate glycosyltransferase
MPRAAADGRPVSLSIVVPCYNEVDGIPELIRRCVAAAQDAVGDLFEIILVDDGSTDRTWQVILEWLQQEERIVAIKLSRNFGHQLALTAGLSAVNGEIVLVVDADLQDPPELLQEMMSIMKRESADVVYGQRRSRPAENWFKKQSASAFYRLLRKTTHITIPVDTGDFRLMTRRVADLVAQMPERDRFIRGMVASVGFKQVPMLYDRRPRFAGTTKYPFSKMLGFAIDAFLGYSMVLLRLSSLSALLLLFAIVAVSAYSLYSWLYLEVVPGWTSLMISLLVVSFFQLASLSIISEYVGRIYLSTKARPLFIIDQIRRND